MVDNGGQRTLSTRQQRRGKEDYANWRTGAIFSEQSKLHRQEDYNDV
jgi:hypothetical protein